MSAEVISDKSVQTVSRLLRNEFDRFPHQWQFTIRHEIIKAARDFGLDALADQMEHDL